MRAWAGGEGGHAGGRAAQVDVELTAAKRSVSVCAVWQGEGALADTGDTADDGDGGGPGHPLRAAEHTDQLTVLTVPAGEVSRRRGQLRGAGKATAVAGATGRAVTVAVSACVTFLTGIMVTGPVTTTTSPPQHLHMSLAHLRPRLDAELVHQPGTQVTVDHQRLRLPTGAVQGEHQLPVVRLPQRMLGGQRRQLGHEIGGVSGTKGEFGVVPPLQEQQPRLTQPSHQGVPAHFRGSPARGVPRHSASASPHSRATRSQSRAACAARAAAVCASKSCTSVSPSSTRSRYPVGTASSRPGSSSSRRSRAT